MVSLHVNGARMGFTQAGEPFTGDFRDAGQREFAGQVVFQAMSAFLLGSVHVSAAKDDSFLRRLDGIVEQDAAQEHVQRAKLHLEAALLSIMRMAPFFSVSSFNNTCPYILKL